MVGCGLCFVCFNNSFDLFATYVLVLLVVLCFVLIVCYLCMLGWGWWCCFGFEVIGFVGFVFCLKIVCLLYLCCRFFLDIVVLFIWFSCLGLCLLLWFWFGVAGGCLCCYKMHLWFLCLFFLCGVCLLCCLCRVWILTIDCLFVCLFVRWWVCVFGWYGLPVLVWCVVVGWVFVCGLFCLDYSLWFVLLADCVVILVVGCYV